MPRNRVLYQKTLNQVNLVLYFLHGIRSYQKYVIKIRSQSQEDILKVKLARIDPRQ